MCVFPLPKYSILDYNKDILMCDQVLIAAILEELGYFDEKMEKDKKIEVDNERRNKVNSKNSWEEEQNENNSFIHA
jgi:hypothetical protein